MTLGEWVHCDGYIKKSGNHYNVIPWKEKRQAAAGGYPITNFEPHIDAAIFEDSDKNMFEVEDEHYCERIKFIEHPFDGIFVGVKSVCMMLSCGYDEDAKIIFEKYNPIDVAIIYYQVGRKRLVPLDKLSIVEAKSRE